MAKLLLLDDEPETLEWMMAALTSLGHEVHGYTSGREAFSAMNGWRPDLIVTDILMPEMDGLTFTRLVRACGGPPVLIVSIAIKQAEAILAGAVGYVQKPATATEVRRAVDEVLGQASSRSLILVVDDDPDAREIYRSFLEPRFRVVEAENGAVALRILRSSRVHLVIADVHMPVVNGVELIRAMRNDKDLERIPVIVQTADLTALSAPVWRELRVAHRVDKMEFLGWLSRHIDARLDGRSSPLSTSP